MTWMTENLQRQAPGMIIMTTRGRRIIQFQQEANSGQQFVLIEVIMAFITIDNTSFMG